MKRGWFKAWRMSYPESSYYKLGVAARSVWMELLQLADHRTGEVEVGRRYLSERAGVPERTTRNALVRLAKLGMISLSDPAHNTAHFTAHPRTRVKILKWFAFQGEMQDNYAHNTAHNTAHVQEERRKKKPVGPWVSALTLLRGLGYTLTRVDEQQVVRRVRSGEDPVLVAAKVVVGVSMLGHLNPAVALAARHAGLFDKYAREVEGVRQQLAERRDDPGGPGAIREDPEEVSARASRLPGPGTNGEAGKRPVHRAGGTPWQLQDDPGLGLGGEPGDAGEGGSLGRPGAEWERDGDDGD